MLRPQSTFGSCSASNSHTVESVAFKFDLIPLCSHSVRANLRLQPRLDQLLLCYLRPCKFSNDGIPETLASSRSETKKLIQKYKPQTTQARVVVTRFIRSGPATISNHVQDRNNLKLRSFTRPHTLVTVSCSSVGLSTTLF